MSRFRPIVFDLDGTLVDSAPDLHAAANRMLAELGRPPVTLGQVTGFIGNGVPKLVERCLEATGEAEGEAAGGAGGHAEAVARFRRHYDAAPAELTRPYPGALAAARALRDAGCRLGICTNKPEAPARKLLSLLGMDDLFDAVVGGDTSPSQKPDPAPLRLAIEALGGAHASALFVGDSEVDALTAGNADVAFALFTRGYRRAPVERLRAALAFDDFVRLVDFALAPAEERPQMPACETPSYGAVSN
jgi:phosphoglycolate phosphatase